METSDTEYQYKGVFIKSVITISTLGVFFGLGSGFGGVGFWRETKIYDSFTNLLFNK